MLEGLQGSQNRCRECLESAGEDVSPPSGPKEGARGAQGTQSGGVRAVMVAKNEPGVRGPAGVPGGSQWVLKLRRTVKGRNDFPLKTS